MLAEKLSELGDYPNEATRQFRIEARNTYVGTRLDVLRNIWQEVRPRSGTEANATKQENNNPDKDLFWSDARISHDDGRQMLRLLHVVASHAARERHCSFCDYDQATQFVQVHHSEDCPVILAKKFQDRYGKVETPENPES